jgi:hypothetical protein
MVRGVRASRRSLARHSFAVRVACAALLVAARLLSGQEATPPAASATPAEGRVAGQILRVTDAGERPVARQWVVLHGIGAAGGRAIDSVRTTAAGDFRLRYRFLDDSTAQYFVTTVHHGIAYVSGVLPPDATSNDATLTVFDTTSAPLPLDVRGRHVLVFAPANGPRRRVAEIYDLSNDTTLTRVTPDGGPPIWTGVIPTGFEEFSSGPEMSSNETIRLLDGKVAAFAPVAPGLKRLAFTYTLPAKAFPASFLVEEPTQLLEVLVEDQGADVAGGGLTEVSPTTIEGRTFRRFQAQDVAAASVVTVRVPNVSVSSASSSRGALVAAIGIIMAAALMVALRRRRGAVRTPAGAAAPRDDPAEALAREIAELDAAFDRRRDAGEAERAEYERRRAHLKRQLAERLAPHRGAL